MSELILKNKNLTLRPFNENDVQNVHDLLIKTESVEFNTGNYPKDIEETKMKVFDWIKESKDEDRRNFTFLIETKNKNFVGLIGLNVIKKKYKNAETWFTLSPKFWGRGFATNALNNVIKFGFEELNLHRIEAGCAINNIASYKVMEKAGMMREAHRRKLLPLKNGWSDNYQYAILEEDYENT